jgi:hypothetical protein
VSLRSSAGWIGTTLLLLAMAGACDGDDPPPLTPPARLHHVVTGNAELVGDGDGACSRGQAPDGTGGRWCAFYRHTADGAGTELWVADFTRPVPVVCDGSSPSCVRLTSTLWTGLPLGAPAHPFIHRFDGDTLVFYADATSKDPFDDPYAGPVRAWRPGWPQSRVLTGAAGAFCMGQARSRSALCLDNIIARGGRYELDLLGGVLDDPAGGVLGTVAHVNPTAKDGSVVWQVAFSPDGAHLAFSSPGSDGQTEVLRVIAAADVGRTTARDIVNGATRWQIAHDSQKVYFLKDVVTAMNSANGTLAIADFPTGANAVALQERVGNLTVLGQPGGVDQGVAFLQDAVGTRGTLRIQHDRARPEDVVTVFHNVRDPLLSPDLNYTSFSSVDGQGKRAGMIAANDGRGVCTLSFKPGFDAYGVAFTPHQRFVLWAEDASDDAATAIEGFYADPEGCVRKRRFSRSLALARPVGHEVLYGEPEGLQGTMVLKHAALTNQGLPDDGGDELGRGVDSTLAVADGFIVFTVNHGQAEDFGIWVYGPVP